MDIFQLDIIPLVKYLIALPGYFFWKNRIYFTKHDFNVAISLQHDNSELNMAIHNEIVKNIHKLITEYDLNEHVKLKEISRFKKFDNKADAKKYREKTGVHLLIWGDFTPSNLKKDTKTIIDPRLVFTYASPSIGNIKESMKNEIGTVAAYQRVFRQIDKDNSYDEVKSLPRDILNLSIYILAVILFHTGKFEKSIKLFETLLNKDLDINVNERIIKNLVTVYSFMLQTMVWEKGDAIYKKGLSYSNKILKYDEKNISALVSKAYYLYRTGDFVGAGQLSNTLLLEYPESHFTWINLAFIYLRLKKYKKSLMFYEKFNNVEEAHFDVLQVIDFLEEARDQMDEVGLLFALGYLYMNYADKDVGSEYLLAFVKKAPHGTYKKMRRTAKSILRKHKQL